MQYFLGQWEPKAYSTDNIPVVILIMVMMILCWVLEIFPLWFTALMPLIIAPIFDIMSVAQLAPSYLNDVSFLFFSGFLIGQVISEWQLHLWISERILRWSQSRLVATWAALSCLAFLLSMWIANVVAAIMLMSVAEGIIIELKARVGDEWDKCRSFATIMVLSIAYASSLGGIATLIGTAPNALLSSFVMETQSMELGMLEWLVYISPFAVTSLILMLVYMYFYGIRSIPPELLIIDKDRHSKHREKSLSSAQLAVIVIFGLVVVMWVGKSFLKNALNMPTLSDAWIGLIGVGALNFVPTAMTPDKRIMSSKAIRSIPWDILILIGGGMCLAKLMSVFNVDRLMIDMLSVVKFDHPWILIVFAILFINIATEITSNTAITIAALPIFFTLAKANGLDVMRVMVPVTISASMAFMLPTATPPNAVSFATGYVSMKEMIRIGFYFKLLIIILSIFYFSLT